MNNINMFYLGMITSVFISWLVFILTNKNMMYNIKIFILRLKIGCKNIITSKDRKQGFYC